MFGESALVERRVEQTNLVQTFSDWVLCFIAFLTYTIVLTMGLGI